MTEGQVKGKILRRTDHEGPEESTGTAILFLESRPWLGVGGQRHILNLMGNKIFYAILCPVREIFSHCRQY